VLFIHTFRMSHVGLRGVRGCREGDARLGGGKEDETETGRRLETETGTRLGDGNRDAISIDGDWLLRLLGKLIATRFPYALMA